MKKFNVNILDTRSVYFSVLAQSKKEAIKKVRDIIENTDIVDNMNAEFSTAFKVIEADNVDEDMCDGDCEGCLYDYEDECLLEELY
ncbi:MAG: hypothetical protein NC177_17245 [Ruminococcus flavefaciens]|nr:hypothetical protein [Ruminococcus flavefaciens]